MQMSETETSARNEGFKIKKTNTLRKMRLLFKGVRMISGVRAMISVKGDTFLENFSISLVAPDGKTCISVPVKLDIMAVNTLNRKVELHSVVQQKILPHLYLTYSNRQLSLQFDDTLHREKVSLIINLKNWGYTSVILWQMEDVIVISLTDPCYEKRVNKAWLLPFEHNLISVPVKRLIQMLEQHLKYVCGNDDPIEWSDSAESVFLKKESSSKLMNDEYIKESLGTQFLNRVWEIEITINAVDYYIQCFSYMSLRKILISAGTKTLEVNPTSPMYRFILGLQSIDLMKNPKTFCSSLELRKLIKSWAIA
jgi:hypothetical protein